MAAPRRNSQRRLVETEGGGFEGGKLFPIAESVFRERCFFDFNRFQPNELNPSGKRESNRDRARPAILRLTRRNRDCATRNGALYHEKKLQAVTGITSGK
jgi:hypothetical protein